MLLQDLAKILRECAHVETLWSDTATMYLPLSSRTTGGEAIQFYRDFRKRVIEYAKDNPGMRNIEISVGWSSCNDVYNETKEELINRAISNMRLLD